MGEVYRATDTQLDREVAIKVLPPTFTEDPERLARFEREAKLLAQLNHPNIAQIHGLETSGATRALVMELVEGPTLAERLEAGALSPSEALSVARQIAEALEEAHEKGIVHRDLKPQNVKASREGRVKVLDFGLAKAMDPATEAAGSAASLANSPTLTAGATALGMVLGSAAYMAPEQARGGVVDRRADIWAFGVVLLEMLSGRRLFDEATVTDTLAAVLRQEIDLGVVPAETPAKLRRLLRRCLTRDPRSRLRDIGDARLVIEEVEGHRNDEEGAVVAVAPPARSRFVGLAAMTAVVGGLAFLAGWLLRPAPLAPEPTVAHDVRVRQLTFEPGLEAEPSLSPDGNTIAYTSNDRGPLDIVLLPLGGGEPRRLVASDADDAHPAWSPDGTRIAFTSARDREGKLLVVGNIGSRSSFVQGGAGDLFVVPSAGGAPSRLTENASYPTWSPDGLEIAFQSDRSGGWEIWKIPAQGGEAIRLTDDDLIDFQPAWSPDGRWIAFASGPGLRVVAADGRSPAIMIEDPVPIDQGALSPSWSADGRWIYYATDRSAPPGRTRLWRVGFPLPSEGAARFERVTLGESSDIEPDLSRSGRRLVYSRVTYVPNLWELDLGTRAVRRITSTASSEDYPSVAPDGRRLLYVSDRGSDRSAVWLLDLSSGERRLVSPATEDNVQNPAWSPDGRRLAYERVGGDRFAIVSQEVGSLSARELLTGSNDGRANSPTWSPDGRQIAIARSSSGEGDAIAVIGADGGLRILARPDGVLADPTWSPDGETIAFQQDRGDRPRQIWIVPAAGGEARPLRSPPIELSHPHWSPVDPDRILVVVKHENLAFLSVSTGELEYVTEFHRSNLVVDYPSMAWDGSKAYFSVTEKTGDLFLLEEF